MTRQVALSCGTAPPIALYDVSVGDTHVQPVLVATQPVTVEQWRSVTKSDCGRFGQDPEYAVQISWLQAKDFCRRLTEDNFDCLNGLGHGVVVNLPTYGQWECALVGIQSNMVFERSEEVGDDTESLHIRAHSGLDQPWEFVNGLYELCLDANPQEHRDIIIGTARPRGYTTDVYTDVTRSEEQRTESCTLPTARGHLLPHIRDIRGVRLEPNSSNVILCRSYGPSGIVGPEVHGKYDGFRIAIHSLASGTANASSPQILTCIWGKVVVGGSGVFKDVKLYPGGARQWDWIETNTRHDPGVGSADVMELIEWGAKEIVLGCGFDHKLQVTPELRAFLSDRRIPLIALNTADAINVYNERAQSGAAVGALMHSTC